MAAVSTKDALHREDSLEETPIHFQGPPLAGSIDTVTSPMAGVSINGTDLNEDSAAAQFPNNFLDRIPSRFEMRILGDILYWEEDIDYELLGLILGLPRSLVENSRSPHYYNVSFGAGTTEHILSHWSTTLPATWGRLLDALEKIPSVTPSQLERIRQRILLIKTFSDEDH
jgi:hypothetical protein